MLDGFDITPATPSIQLKLDLIAAAFPNSGKENKGVLRGYLGEEGSAKA